MNAPSTIPPPAAVTRNAYIDTLRGWSIVGVVCVHFAGSFVTTDVHAWSPSFFVGLGLNQFFSFAVPLFLFLSGLLSGRSRRQGTLGNYYRDRLWRIGFPYLLASIASFFLLNHHTTWSALPGLSAKFQWLLQRVFFTGVEPTLYFIPLIIQFYLLLPALKALPGWMSRLVPTLKPVWFVLIITGLLLVLHVWLGLRCSAGTLNYYVWGRPNVLFWAFYFFCGLHFDALVGSLSRRQLSRLGSIALALAVGAMLWNFNRLVDPMVVGFNFELNRLDFAYARPELLVYDAAMVLALATGIVLGWSPRPTPLTHLGRYTLEIYLWHILVLYYGAWRYPEVLASCRQVPELIVIICFAAAIFIAMVTGLLRRSLAYIKTHRLVLLAVPAADAGSKH